MPSTSRSFNKWDIWDFDQVAARANTDPQQPLDPMRPNRRYLIISDNAYLKTTNENTKLLCLPIGENQTQASQLFNVVLKAGQAGCTKDCFVWCHEIYTLKAKYFFKKHGNAGFLESNVKRCLKILLDLRT